MDINTDMYENDKLVIIKLEFPGVSRRNLKIDILDNHLFIEGKKENDTKGFTPILTECTYGTFNRIIPLPEGTRDDYIAIDRIDGVITLKIPKRSNNA